MNAPGGILILDFGSQFTQLIARRIRELGVFSQILPFNTSLEEIKKNKPQGIILSGGPHSVYDAKAPSRSDLKELLDVAPILGVCYGMQLLSHNLGGQVKSSPTREYGRAKIHWTEKDQTQVVWMSHGDYVTDLPTGSRGLAKTENQIWASFENRTQGRGYWALQFHPEVSHTENGVEILKSFVFDWAQAKADWKGSNLIQHLVDGIKEKVGSGKVLCALSGGVDSTVTATLLTKALGKDRVHSVFVDTGLLRHKEVEDVTSIYSKIGLDVQVFDASREFLSQLKGVTDPEVKRKTIGRLFIESFEKAIQGQAYEFLAQGTLYPDVIESVSVYGQSVTIKSHHNVGGLPEKMKMKLVEPLRELFKDEVRLIGKELGIPSVFLGRHPFPGPGLAVRVIGEIKEADLNVLRLADHIFISELREKGFYDQIWQAFAVLLPVSTVGVMGDGRTYEKVIALRAVTSHDGMTADWFQFDPGFLAHVSNRITNEVRGVNRVVYDISSKPPSTIEWE